MVVPNGVDTAWAYGTYGDPGTDTYYMQVKYWGGNDNHHGFRLWNTYDNTSPLWVDGTGVSYINSISANTVIVNGINVLTQINYAYNQANTATDYALSAGSYANGAFVQANSAYGVSNSAASFANGAFVMANSAYVAQNTTASFANSAFTVANSASSNTVTIQGVDLTQNTNISSAQSFANGAFVQANSGYGVANSAYASINSNWTVTNALYSVANAAYGAANNITPQIAPSYNTANSAYNTANAGYASINSNWTVTNTVYGVANAAYNYANASNTYAESTFLKLTAPSQTVTGNLTVTGNFTLLGNATTISSNNLIVGDSMIYLAANNYSGTDILDIGFVANYANGTGANVHTGLLRDATNKQYYLFQGLDIELQANNTAFTPGANGVVNAVLNADLVTSNLTLGGANAINWIGAAYGAANNVSTQIAPSYNTANAAYNQNNVIFGVANSAYGKANTGLQNTSMTIAGDIKIAGNFAVNNFIEFDTTIGYNYTITTGRNAFTAGPVSIANGNTVTIPSGSYWTVT